MPKALGTLLNHAFTIAGVKSDNSDLIAILSNPELSKVMVPDDIAAQIESNLFSENAAKSKLYPKWKAEDLNGVDAHIERLFPDLGFDDAITNELKGEKLTGKRVEMMLKKVKELEASKAEASGKGKDKNVEEFTRQINELKGQLSKAAQDAQAALEAERNKNTESLNDMILRQLLSSFNYVFPEDMDPDVKLDTVSGVVKRALSTSGAKVINKNGRMELVTEKDGTDFYDATNKKVDLKAFVEGELSRNKLLKTTAAPGTPGAGGGNQQVITGNGKMNAHDQQLISDLDKQIAEAMAQST